MKKILKFYSNYLKYDDDIIYYNNILDIVNNGREVIVSTLNKNILMYYNDISNFKYNSSTELYNKIMLLSKFVKITITTVNMVLNEKQDKLPVGVNEAYLYSNNNNISWKKINSYYPSGW